MAWIEFHINTTARYTDEIGDQLTDFGAQALTMKDAGNEPILEPALDKVPPLWSEVILVALFDAGEDIIPVTAYLQQQVDDKLIKDFTFESLADEDWERRCLDSFQPLQFGKRLWICPSWQTPPDPEAVNVIVDPGLAFGTGTHATTALCLEWLDANVKANETLIDYGCGSGILAIAALKLGAKHAAAVDFDPKALTATGENAALNQVSGEQLFISLPDTFASEPVDLVIANILAQPLIELAPRLSAYVKTGGRLLLSGILFEQSDSIINRYSQWFDMQPLVSKEEWVCLSGTRR